jgi:hypothetical protein
LTAEKPWVMTTVGTGPAALSGRYRHPSSVIPRRRLDVVPHRCPLSSAGRLQGVADGLHPDQAVAEHEGVDAVLDAVAATLGAPLQEQDVAFVDGGLDVPGGLRDLAEELVDA